MILTKEIFQQGKSRNNGWNNLQMEALGVTNHIKGWMKRLIGSDIPEEKIKEFLELKDYHFKDKPVGYKNPKLKRLPVFEYCDSNILYKDQYLHPNWQKMRLFILNRDNFKCVECESKDKTLHVHHLKYVKNGFVWGVPHWYLVTLCEVCHSKEHGRDLTLSNNKL